MDPRISQAIEFSSALLVMGKRENGSYITDDECMRYLKDAPVSDASLIAYRFLCLNRNPNEHYIDGVHLLRYIYEKADEYGAIYVLSKGESETKVKKKNDDDDDDSGETVTNYLMKSVFRLQMDKRFGTKVRIICNRSEDEVGDIPRDLLPLILKANSNKLSSCLSPLSELDRAEIMLNIDRVKFLKGIEMPDKFGRILARCSFLSEKAPAYWKAFASGEYRKSIVKLHKKGQLGDITRAHVTECHRLLPGIFPTNIDQYSDLAYKVALLDDTIRQYVLGFPIHRGNPTLETVSSALAFLSKEGKEKYVEMMRNFTSEATSLIPEHFTSGKLTKQNEKDVLEENPADYPLFDRLTYFSGMNVYTFTRPEFEQLNKSDKNQYTNEDLPLAIQMEISLRLQLAQKLNLPPPGTMMELLTRVEKGELYESSFDKEKKKRRGSPQRGSNDSFRSALMDLMLSSMLFNGIGS